MCVCAAMCVYIDECMCAELLQTQYTYCGDHLCIKKAKRY